MGLVVAVESKKSVAGEPHILVVDDQSDVTAALRLLFKGEGWRVTAVNEPRAARKLVKSRSFDLAVADLNYSRDTTSGQEGLALLRSMGEVDPELPIVVMTAWGSVELAVAAVQSGARDFVEKPWQNTRLLSIVRNQLALGASLRRGYRLPAQNRALAGTDRPAEMIAGAPSMRSLLELVERVAPSDANVLITGNHGTGKSMLAKYVHQCSERADQPLVTVNMGGLAETVFESEMFGHKKGAFTDAKADRIGRFEMADGGTLFMDEVANVPLPQQAKLLRVLEEGEFERLGSSRTRRANVRVISATNARLTELVGRGDFRQDLLFRLNTVEIPLPPLRDRREDLQPMADRFLVEFGARYRRRLTLSATAQQALAAHSWPGNVRELRHVLERAVLIASESQIQPRDLGLSGADAGNLDWTELTLEQAEQKLIEAALARHNGAVRKAADSLGISRSALYRRLEKFGIAVAQLD